MRSHLQVQAPDHDNAPPPPTRPQSFRERHALKILGVLMVASLATVIVAQVGC